MQTRTHVQTPGGGAIASAARLDELFDEVCRKYPDHVAVVDGDLALTYRQLQDRADRLAGHLAGRGAVPGGLIGLAAKPGADLIVGLLAILKSGAGYLALDPGYPAARISYLLRDSKPRIVLSSGEMFAKVGGFGASIVALDGWGSRPDGAEPQAVSQTGAQAGARTGAQTEARPEMSPADAAYVIYTSGTTGDPKGVVVEHRQVARLFAATEPWFGFGEQDVWTLFHSASFDFSVWEIWGALLYGGRLVIVPAMARRHPAGLLKVLAEQRVTVLNQTPSAFRNLLLAEERDPDAVPDSLRLVVFGGERLDVGILGPFMARHPGVRLVNMYGITETTVHVTYRPITPADLDSPGVSPIGVPIPDLAVELRGPDGGPVPDGESGEMWISGAGLARGYLGRPELTGEKFVTGPDGVRAYRSGDRAVRVGGELRYLGRTDDQLKVNGFRIEPGEIEAALRRHPGITDAVVTAVPGADGAAELLALVVPGPEATGTAEEMEAEWRGFLQERVPAHLRPARYHPVAALDLTANGKVDRASAASLAGRLPAGAPPEAQTRRST